MAIKIGEKVPEIDVIIGELEFKFYVTDEAVLRFRKDADKIMKELDSIDVDEALSDEENIENVKGILRRGFDLMLGDGAFDKIYKNTPSVMYLMSYLIKLSNGIGDEIKRLGAFDTTVVDKAKKYLKNKK